MSMPETAMNKNHRPLLPQYQIGTPGQFLRVKTVPDSMRMQPPANRHFRPRVLAADR